MSEYIPKTPEERHHFDHLWQYVAGPEGTTIAGPAAVGFFRESKVDGGFLKQIWTMSTPDATMNRTQFNVALRFITMAQNGEFPLTKDRFESTKRDNMGLPKFASIHVPPLPKPTPAPAPVPVAAHSPVPGPNPAFGHGHGPAHAPGAPPAMSPFAITPEDHFKYHQVYLSYGKSEWKGRWEEEMQSDTFMQTHHRVTY